MKKIFINLVMVLNSLLIFTTSAYAGSYRAFCGGNRGKVAISIYSQEGSTGKKIIFKYNNLLGADDFPFYEGVVSKITLPFIDIAKSDLSPLGEEVIVAFPAEKCNFNEAEPLLIQCYGLGEFISPKNTQLESYTLTVAKVREENLTASFDMIKIRWGIDSVNLHHSLALPFDPKNCIAEFKK